MPFQTDDDLQWQMRVGQRTKEAWGAELHPFGAMDEVDGWLERDGQVWAICEIKRRYVKHDTYPTIWVSLRKWQSLLLVQQGFGVPGLFIVHYDDGIYWHETQSMVRHKIVIGGREDRGVANDREPVIDVPVGEMIKL